MKKVLIVDDEKSFLLSLQDGLSVYSDKFEVLTAGNGREAIEVMQATPIDMLVTDLKLPVMDGFELLAWVSRRHPYMPVIVMTAFGTPEIEARLAKMNTLQYLEKPLDFQVLQDGIFNGLDSRDKSYIRGITLATFLQLMSIEQKTCTLKVTSDDGIGYLFIRRGELLDAETEQKTGEEAALDILSWENAEIEMDGICRRQQGPINLALEHILIEAFRIKDERRKAEEDAKALARSNPPKPAKQEISENKVEKAPPPNETRPLSPEELQRKRLIEVLSKLAPVLEYAVFDQKSFLLEKNSGSCGLEELDPGVFIHLLEMVDSQLSFGSFNSLMLSTSGRHRYLLFCIKNDRVLLKLKPGMQPQQVVKEVKRYVNK